MIFINSIAFSVYIAALQMFDFREKLGERYRLRRVDDIGRVGRHADRLLGHKADNIHCSNIKEMQIYLRFNQHHL